MKKMYARKYAEASLNVAVLSILLEARILSGMDKIFAEIDLCKC
jgi:hypothetical protein